MGGLRYYFDAIAWHCLRPLTTISIDPMDIHTARLFLIDQGTALQTRQNPDALLCLLDRGLAPIPGQMTSVLLALKVVYKAFEGQTNLDRELTYALHRLTIDSQRAFLKGMRRGVVWPPLLAEDLERVAIAVDGIFSGVWDTPASQATIQTPAQRQIRGQAVSLLPEG